MSSQISLWVLYLVVLGIVMQSFKYVSLGIILQEWMRHYVITTWRRKLTKKFSWTIPTILIATSDWVSVLTFFGVKCNAFLLVVQEMSVEYWNLKPMGLLQHTFVTLLGHNYKVVSLLLRNIIIFFRRKVT